MRFRLLFALAACLLTVLSEAVSADPSSGAKLAAGFGIGLALAAIVVLLAAGAPD